MNEELVSQDAQEEVSPDTVEETSEVTAEQQTGSEEDSETSTEEEQEKPRKAKGGFQRRIDRLTQEKRILEGLVEQLAGRGPAAQHTEQPVEKPQGKPQAKDFTDYDSYVEALGAWGAEQRLAQERQRYEQETARQRQQAQLTEWETRQEAARKEIADYDEVLADAEDVPMSPAMRAAIVESDLGPKVAYHLAKHPAEAQRIAQLSPMAAAREIGRLEAKLTSTPKKTAPVTRAPEPIRPVGAKSGAAVRKPLTEVTDFAEYVSRRKAGER